MSLYLTICPLHYISVDKVMRSLYNSSMSDLVLLHTFSDVCLEALQLREALCLKLILL